MANLFFGRHQKLPIKSIERFSENRLSWPFSEKQFIASDQETPYAEREELQDLQEEVHHTGPRGPRIHDTVGALRERLEGRSWPDFCWMKSIPGPE